MAGHLIQNFVTCVIYITWNRPYDLFYIEYNLLYIGWGVICCQWNETRISHELFCVQWIAWYSVYNRLYKYIYYFRKGTMDLLYCNGRYNRKGASRSYIIWINCYERWPQGLWKWKQFKLYTVKLLKTNLQSPGSKGGYIILTVCISPISAWIPMTFQTYSNI